MAGVIGQIAFDHVRPDDDHQLGIAGISKNWKSCAGERDRVIGECRSSWRAVA
jgi:hypothetical protein